jgi:ketosteroid isomerase-like protein
MNALLDMKIRRAGLGLALLLVAGTGRAATAAPDPQAQIRHALEQWPRDFAAGNAGAVCGLFARDLVATYPGQADRDYQALCADLTASMHDAQRKFRYDTPRIEVLLVSGDLAVVRLVWTLRISTPGADEGPPGYERGVDVFRRQSDGSWKVSISHSYPDAAAGQN